MNQTSATSPEIQERYQAAKKITTEAADAAMGLFYQRDELVIESKGAQDWVSNADRDIETLVRSQLAEHFPQDSIVGEEHDNIIGESSYTWIIDPIDGTSSFVNGIPGWCVVVACIRNNETVLGVIVDPIAKECFSAYEGGVATLGVATLGVATLNEKPIEVSKADNLSGGSVALGYCARHDKEITLRMASNLINQGGVFYRIGSGALMLAYVASGRLLGYVEQHMYAWDCVAGLFIIEKAGGQCVPFDMESMVANGGQVITGGPGVFDTLRAL